MSRLFLPLMAASLIALVMASGCIFPDVDAINKVKANPATGDFLAEHPMAQLTASAWSESESRQRMAELVEKCGPQVNPTDYYYVAFSESGAVLEGWVFQRTMNVACVHRSDDQCVADIGCDDGFACTRNTCEGIPKKCSSVKIRECAGGDGCCPQGCTYALDFDCPMDECSTDADCDDGNESTIGTCAGSPKKCGYEAIKQCINDDNVCESWCDSGNDSDCGVKKCVTASDCDDHDAATLDFCEEGVCVHQNTAQCANNDGYCPARCAYKNDTDCLANAGDIERIVVTCNGESTIIDAPLGYSENELVAHFDGVVNSSNNGALKYYTARRYKYDYRETGYGGAETGLQTGISERIKIQGMAVYDQGKKARSFYFNKDGFNYEVEFFQGVPVTQKAYTDEPFFAGNGDSIPVVLFGKDSLFVMASQEDGNQQASILSDYVELSVKSNGAIGKITGKNGLDYSMRVSRCDEDSAVFSLYLGENFVEGQKVETGSILFPSLLKNTVRINYLYKNSVSGQCDYKYAKGAYLENFYQGKQFPADYSNKVPWIANLEFGNNKLKKIQLSNTDSSNLVMEKDGTELLLQEGETAGLGFCTIKFQGLVK